VLKILVQIWVYIVHFKANLYTNGCLQLAISDSGNIAVDFLVLSFSVSKFNQKSQYKIRELSFESVDEVFVWCASPAGSRQRWSTKESSRRSDDRVILENSCGRQARVQASHYQPNKKKRKVFKLEPGGLLCAAVAARVGGARNCSRTGVCSRTHNVSWREPVRASKNLFSCLRFGSIIAPPKRYAIIWARVSNAPCGEISSFSHALDALTRILIAAHNIQNSPRLCRLWKNKARVSWIVVRKRLGFFLIISRCKVNFNFFTTYFLCQFSHLIKITNLLLDGYSISILPTLHLPC
jgi:hypothetical protein